MSTLFLEPLDVLFLRGNKLFGDPGSTGDAQMPPNPSVVAGALRSRMLADAGVDVAAFARGEIVHPSLGTPTAPGGFTLAAFHLARRDNDGVVEALFAPPADLVLTKAVGQTFPRATALRPAAFAQGIQSSASLPCVPVLAQEKREKPVSGWWLTAAGWQAVLAGKLPAAAEHWIEAARLWSLDERIGIGLSAATRSVNEGQLFTTQAIAFRPGTGFLARVTGCDEDALPSTGSLRLGGDGRAAALHPATVELPAPDYAALAAAKRLRLILTAPGLFAAGWLPTGVTESGGDVRFDLHGVRGKLVAAAVPRAEVVSGWDLANWRPKTAERAAPVGSVYWLDEVEADEAALRKLADDGLWLAPDENPARRAEGFNRCALATWF